MGLFKTPRTEVLPGLDVPPEVLKRVEQIPSSDLQVWFESSLGGLGVTYDQWLAGTAPDDEVTVSLQALWAMWEEMQRRGRINNGFAR